MKLLATFIVTVIASAASVTAQAQPASAPPLAVGQPWYPALTPQWLDEAPSVPDSAGKLTMHWFCAPKNAACKDDLARVLSLRDAGKIYVIAYVMGSKKDALKFNPIGDAVGAGAVGYGPKVAKLMGTYGLGAGPAAIVINVDGKVAMIANGGDTAKADERDKKLNELVSGIKEFTVTGRGPVAAVKTGQRFELGVDIELATWLAFDRKAITEFSLTVSPDFKCETLSLKGDNVKIDGRKLSASIGCVVAGTGAYEARAQFRFGYKNPNGTSAAASALGQDSLGWKFAVAK
jgi:hypothetical protein